MFTDSPRRLRTFVVLASVALTAVSRRAGAGVKEDLGITRLNDEQGVVLNGAGVPVAQVEANNAGGYFPTTDANPTGGDFAGRHFTFVTATANPTVALSGHAQVVGANYYGLANGTAPGATDVSVYSLEGWNEKVWRSGTIEPAAIDARVVNHSYLIDQSQLGTFLPPRVDFMTE